MNGEVAESKGNRINDWAGHRSGRLLIAGAQEEGFEIGHLWKRGMDRMVDRTPAFADNLDVLPISTRDPRQRFDMFVPIKVVRARALTINPPI